MKVVRHKLVILMLVLIMFCSIFTGCGKSVANVWLVDSIAPTSSTKGTNGDMYLNTSNYDLYQMQDSKWIKIGNIAGKDGVTPTIEISEDGYWIINGKKTTTRAQGRDGKDGKDGKDGISPLISISEDGYWVINGVKTAVKAKAQDGKDGSDGKDGKDGINGANGNDGIAPVVEFSEDGYWVINGVKTKIKAEGKDGKTPTVEISEDGYWVINGIKTKIKAICKNCITQYQESDNIEVPDLYNYTLTPVKYNGKDWVVADVRQKWYSYKDQEWANAVLLDSGVRKTIGDTVKVDGTEALAMYVWIPKFEYKIEGAYGKGGTSLFAPGEIEVNFIAQEVQTASSGYKIHPAFTFGDAKISGMWVAKFELSHTTKTTESMSCTSENCLEGNNIRILPDRPALSSNTVSSFFYGIKSMEQKGNVFGIDKEVTDSHMIKNSEWGAVAYLSQSKYGKYGNSNYTGAEKEVYINNSNSVYTGRSGGSYGGNTPVNKIYNGQTSTNQTNEYGYYTYDGYLLSYNTNTKTTTREMNRVASTTGNITGIYDMSGGTWESVMGVFADSNGNLWTGNTSTEHSGFKGKIGTSATNISGLEWPDKKYYDIYKSYNGTNLNPLTACNNGVCYGHAATETNKWYVNYSYFVEAKYPWFMRGGCSSNGDTANLFVLNTTYGNAGVGLGTRSVLVSTSKKVMQKHKIYANGEVVYYDVATGKTCTNYNSENSKTGYNGINNRTGKQNSCLKFYAFNDGENNSLNLILDHNTTATSVWNSSNDNSDGPKEVIELLKKDTKDWKGTIAPKNYTTGISGRQYTVNYSGYTSRLMTANEVAQITGNIGFDENKESTDFAFFFDTNLNSRSQDCTTENTTGCNYRWLYDRTHMECMEDGCLNNSDEDTAGYWLASSNPVLLSSVPQHSGCGYRVSYGVSYRGRLGNTCPNYAGHYGVRPVIEVLKSNL